MVMGYPFESQCFEYFVSEESVTIEKNVRSKPFIPSQNKTKNKKMVIRTGDRCIN